MKQIIILLSLILAHPGLLAQESGSSYGGGHSGVRRKVEAKSKTRWTLADWLAQKQRNHLMDQWLAIHTTDNPYEFFLEYQNTQQAHYLTTSPSSTDAYILNRARGGAYASIAGVEGGYEPAVKGKSAWDASFNLRVLGTAYQNTNVTLKGGVKGRSHEDTITQDVELWQNPFGGVQATLYLNRYFGIQGEYWQYAAEKSNRDNRLWGEYERGVLFIDFSFLRLYGGYNREFLVFNFEQGEERRELRDGYIGGAQLFF